MKKLFTATLLLLVGITLTGCTLLNKQKNADEQIDPPIQKTKITDIFKSNNQECTYTVMTEGSKSTGTIYIADSGKKMYHKMNMELPEGTQEVNYILNGDWMYSWGTMMPGMKMQLSKLKEMGEELSSEQPEETNEFSYEKMGLNEGINMECKKWIPNDSMFNPPSNVEFTDATQTMVDFTEAFKETEEKADDMNNSMCAACNMAPDEQTKKECLASLGCE